MARKDGVPSQIDTKMLCDARIKTNDIYRVGDLVDVGHDEPDMEINSVIFASELCEPFSLKSGVADSFLLYTNF